MEKFLTIIIPTYNMEKYLDKCLTSLIIEDKELMKQLEVLVVIDGAKDRSSEIAHTYQDRYPETFRVIDKENGNYGSCVNRGLKEATGKYVKVLDADDTFNTANFQKLLNLLKKTDADCVLSDMERVQEVGTSMGSTSFDLPTGVTLPIEESFKITNSLWMHNVCYRTENVRKIGYVQTEGISYTDQEWICVPYSTCKTFAYFPEVVYRYLVGREGQTVDINVWEKNLWMEVKSLYAMIESYLHPYNGCTETGKLHIYNRVVYRTKTVYRAALLTFQNHTNDELIKEFDGTLKEKLPDVYMLMNDITPQSFPKNYYIRYWRQDASTYRKKALLRSRIALLFQPRILAWNILHYLGLK